MKKIFYVLITLWSIQVNGQTIEDPRYCAFVPRDAKGEIKRSSAVIAKFRSLYPCPSTGLMTGPCPGWSADHTIPLAVGGCDAFWNMAWLPNVIKSSANPWAKDRWERRIYKVDPTTQGFNPKCCNYSLVIFDDELVIPPSP